MPELPEVETTRRGIAPFVTGHLVEHVLLRRKDLRWPIPRAITAILPGQRIAAVERRAKYLLLHTQAGSALLHLGMSGSLRITDPSLPPRTHDHYDLVFDSGQALASTIRAASVVCCGRSAAKRIRCCRTSVPNRSAMRSTAIGCGTHRAGAARR